MAETQEFIATGRRKTAVARIRMTPGNGKIDINGKSFEDYFPTVPLQNTVLQPLQVVKLTNAYDISVNTTGGGATGQAGAARLAISRALLQVDANLRGTLKAEGLLRRDPRMKERKSAARRAKRFQFSKAVIRPRHPERSREGSRGLTSGNVFGRPLRHGLTSNTPFASRVIVPPAGSLKAPLGTTFMISEKRPARVPRSPVGGPSGWEPSPARVLLPVRLPISATKSAPASPRSPRCCRDIVR